jgi:transcriptional regulator GlxA family with amidase domain
MKLAFVLYPRFTALDLVGPCEVIGRWPDADTHFVATAMSPIRSDLGLIVTPTDTTCSLTDPDVIVVPGSSEPLPVTRDEPLLDWLREAGPRAKWTASVCSGAGAYAAAGLLEGRVTTTHWGFGAILGAMGADVATGRVVWAGTHVSAAGVSAGIDMALALTARVHGDELAKALQLAIEYDPQPPFAAGSPDKADGRTLRLATRLMLGDRPLRAARRVAAHIASTRAQRLLRRFASPRT